MNKFQAKKESPGFALLITIIVVSVIVSIGLSVLDLSIRQVRLSTNAKDSELAFHAANAGMECARYWRRTESDAMENGNALTPLCFGVGTVTNTRQQITTGVTGIGEVFQYNYSFTWGSPEQRCTQVNTIVASSSINGTGLTINNMRTLVPGYPTGTSKVCEPGTKCTVISVQGYNKPCSAANGFGTVQREVLLQL